MKYHTMKMYPLLGHPVMKIYEGGKHKSKVVPVLFLTEHHAIKVYWGVKV
jgi:hypothetical protein